MRRYRLPVQTNLTTLDIYMSQLVSNAEHEVSKQQHFVWKLNGPCFPGPSNIWPEVEIFWLVKHKMYCFTKGTDIHSEHI